ncbi:MAG: hypothetical protein KGH89_08960 [Thaumarchaeota archaeon]|nr:hypothetical protein [Nitrososphaerota archaeon]
MTCAVQGSSALDIYDSKKADKALKMLYADKSNEFHELAHATGYPVTNKDWEKIILNFCLDFDDCFKAWSDANTPSDHKKVHKCMTMMRQIAHGKTNMTEVAKLQTIAYRIAEDFKSIYKRMD